MLTIFLTTLSGLVLFAIGFYLGDQVGSTRHIRKQLEKVRSNKQY